MTTIDSGSSPSRRLGSDAALDGDAAVADIENTRDALLSEARSTLGVTGEDSAASTGCPTTR